MYINTFKYTPKDVSCQLCTEYVKKLGCTALRCPWLAERIEAGVVGYREAVMETFPRDRRLSSRLNLLIKHYPGSLWSNEQHERRMQYQCAVQGYRRRRDTNAYYAAMYLLTSNDDIYRRTVNCFCKDGIEFGYAATVFMTMCVSALALTSLDAVARIARMSFQELFSVDDMAHAEPWRKLLCNTYFSTVLTLVLGYVLTKIGYSNIWPLFGSANQLLSALVLITLCVFLKVTGRSNKMLFPPLVIMLCVTFTALVQRLMAMVSAIQNAAAVTIPAGETTWGAVFIANGLQLIIAVLLIVLGATIVVNSMRSYVASKHNSEAKV